MRIEDYVRRQIEWSTATFGPGERNAGIVEHIRKELEEIEADPDDVMEFIDVVILALDGAWRRLVHKGRSHDEAAKIVLYLLDKKFLKNSSRRWPDWRTAPRGSAIEHVREENE